MTTALVPNELNDLDRNENFADLAEQLAKQAGQPCGSPAWIEAGDGPEPWTTGGHYSEGWNHETVIADPKKRLLILSNYLSRPRNWPFADKRNVGYGPGEYPLSHPGPYGTTLNAGVPNIENVRVYGMDSEHFLAGQLISLCAVRDPTLVSGLIWGTDALPPLTVDALSRVALSQLQISCSGQMLTWLANQVAGLSVRPPDRVTARLLWVALRAAEIVGCDGLNEAVLRAWVENMARWLPQGPHYQTTKEIVTSPPVTMPYWNPVHSYGYMIPTIYMLLGTYGADLPATQRDALGAWIVNAAKELNSVVSWDGKTPWAIDTLGIKGYLSGQNGDEWTPGYEVYTAMRIAELIPGVAPAAPKSQAILDHLGAKAKDPLYSPWLCDAGFQVVA